MASGIQELLQKLSTRQPLPSLAPSGIYSSEATTAIETLDVGNGVKAGGYLNNLVDRKIFV